jgi:hypothetical protein
VLHLHHDVPVVQQHPAAVTLPLASHRLHAALGELLGDRVDDGPDLTLVRTGDDHEAVGQRQPVGHVEDDDVGRALVGGRLRGGERQIAGGVGGGHWFPFSSGCA